MRSISTADLTDAWTPEAEGRHTYSTLRSGTANADGNGSGSFKMLSEFNQSHCDNNTPDT